MDIETPAESIEAKRMRMKNIYKKALELALLLVVALVLTSCSSKKKPSISEEYYEEMTEEQKTIIAGDYTCYMYNYGELEIKDYSGEDEELVLPSELYEMPVTRVSGSYWGTKNLKKITIPKGIKIVLGNPFSGCMNLTTIVVESGHSRLKVVDEGLVDNKVKKMICYPRGVESGTYTVPQGIETIGTYAFAYTKLSAISLPESVKKIESNAFNHCKMKSIDIQEGVETIGMWAFRWCKELTSIRIPKSVTLIGEDVFADADKLTIYVYRDSYAAQYCKENNLQYSFID